MGKSKNYQEPLIEQDLDQNDLNRLAEQNVVMSPYMRNYMEAFNHSLIDQQELPTTVLEDQANSLDIVTDSNYVSSAYMNTFMDAIGQDLEPVEPVEEISFENAYRRRRGFLVIVVILMAAILGIAALGFVGDLIPDFVAAYEKPESTYISLTDPIFGALIKFFDFEAESHFYNDCLKYIENESNIGTIIAFYALPLMSALIIIFALISLICALIGLFKKSITQGYVRGRGKYGFLIFLTFIFSLFMAVCGVVWNNEGGKFIEFFMGDTSFIFIGYGLLAIMAISLVGLIAYLLVYKKVTELEQ